MVTREECLRALNYLVRAQVAIEEGYPNFDFRLLLRIIFSSKEYSDAFEKMLTPIIAENILKLKEKLKEYELL
jgi:rubrerythrin